LKRLLFFLCVTAPLSAQQAWISEGPAPNTFGQVENIEPDDQVVGAIHTVIAHPTDADILWAGAVNGGIWKTENATSVFPTWQRQTDSPEGSLRSLSIGAMDRDPTDATHQTLVAGIGGFSSFSAVGDRIGVLRTTDGGETWTVLPGAGLDEPNISGIIARGNTIVISANTSSENTFATFGVFRSTDGGNSFTQVSIGDGTTTGLPGGQMTDLVGDPANPDRIFTVSRVSANVGGTSGIYRSDDLGASWSKVSDTQIDSLLSGTVSNAELAVGNSNNVYAGICTSGQLRGLFRSGNGGGTWTELDRPSPTIHPGFQASIHFSIVADPTDTNIVYVAGDRQNFPFPNGIGARDYSGNIYRIDAGQPDGSQTAHLTHSASLGPAGGGTASSSSPHADSREMTFDAAGNLIETDDGGIYKRTNPRSNTGDWFSINGTIAVTEFHNIAYDTNADIIMGGAQDTGSSAQTGVAAQEWFSISTADGGDVAVDDTSTPGFSTRYSSNQNLSGLRRQVWNADNEFQSSTFLNGNVVSGSDINPTFVTPIELNHADPLRMIILAGNGTFESFDQGDTFVQLSSTVIYQTPLGADPIAYGANDNEDILYVGSDDRLFVRTGAPPAPLVEALDFPGVPVDFDVRDIKLDRNRGATAFVLTGVAIYMTDDAGDTWTEITGNINSFDPGLFRSLAHRSKPGTLYAGTTRGVYKSSATSGYATWTLAGTGLPNALVWDLDYDDADDVLIAGLTGRGTWILDAADQCPLDLNGDQTVDGDDYDAAVGAWASELFDTNGNGFVDIIDILAVLGGSCP